MTPANTDARAEPFGYVCSHCGGCCHHYLVKLNPYEIARLALRLGQSTRAFEAEYTEAKFSMGRVLRQDPKSGACVFWKGPGCSVYEDRPLACRIYPLGRDVDGSNAEQWRKVVPHRKSKGDYTVTGAIQDYVGGEDNETYMWATDAYTAWIGWVMRRLSGPNAVAPLRPDRFTDFLDLDTALAAHAEETGEAEPTAVMDRVRLHLDILYRQLPPEAPVP